MQIEKHLLYPTMFILGHRMNDSGVPEKIGTIIVKGTFQHIDTPVPVQKEAQIPIFLKDTPFNSVRNSDFEGEDIAPWQATNGEAKKVTGGAEDSDSCVKLTSNGGPNRDLLTQSVILDDPVGGRTFVFSFYAKADFPTTINGFRLQSPESGTTICQFSVTLTETFQEDIFRSPAETWPTDENDSEIEVIMPGSGDAANPVYFDRVQVEEVTEAGTATRWDEDTVFHYEHDLVPFKPYADVIVLGAARPPDVPSDEPPWGLWYAVIETNDGRRIEKAYDATTQEFPTKTTFGWAPRGEGPRLQQAGDNLATFNPTEKPLPDNFKNHFYNGYDRTISGDIPLSHLNDGALLTISSERRPVPPGPISAFDVKLPAERPAATLTVLSNSGHQEEQAIPMAIDTVIIEPALNHYLIVWRGMWEFQEHLKERYIRLSVTGGP